MYTVFMSRGTGSRDEAEEFKPLRRVFECDPGDLQELGGIRTVLAVRRRRRKIHRYHV